MEKHEKPCFGECPKCGAKYNERHDWNYDNWQGKHWFYDYYTCGKCGQDYTEMYVYESTYWEEG